jgi:hypothetical protein
MMRQHGGEFWAKATLLEPLKLLDAPSEAQTQEVLDAIRHEEYRRYFFHELKNPAWLEPLRERGVFKNPPPVARIGTTIECPAWEAAPYLVEMASLRPELVAPIALEVDTDNPSVYLTLIRAAALMPGPQAARLTQRVVDWVAASELWVDLLADAAQELMVHLATEGQADAAIRLLRALTEPVTVERPFTLPGYTGRTVREVRSRCSPWYLKRLIQERLPTLLGLDSVGAAQVLESQLRKAIDLDEGGLLSGDVSDLWRRAIEEHPQNWAADDMKSILTAGLRDALEHAQVAQPLLTRPIIEGYLNDPLSIFRRLALYVIRVGGDACDALAAQAVSDPAVRDDPSLHHEYYCLLEDRFAALPDSVRKEYVDWVGEGPRPDDFREWAEERVDQPPSEQELQVYKEHWQLQRLRPIRDFLSDDWRARYEELVSRHGEPEHPDFLIWSSTTWVGPTSPKKKEQLAEMGPAGTVEYLETFKPSGEPFEESRWGLGQELQAAVEANPGGYVAVANGLLEEQTHPMYVYHLVTGLHEAWKKGADIEWKRLLDLFEQIALPLTGEAPSLAEHLIGIDDVDWVGVRMAISRFLSGALARDDRELAPALLPTIREILLRLIQDADPTRDDEESRYGGPMDWVSIRINTGRGVAASALLEYALRRGRKHKGEQELAAGEQAYAQWMEPTVKAAFTEMLNKQKEPSAAVHSLFGQFLPQFVFLDRQWVESQLDRIFPPDRTKERYWEAAWQGYMLYCPRVYRELYALLRPQYLRALAALPGRDTSTLVRDTAPALVQHIALSYRMGYEELPPPTDGSAAAPSDAESKYFLLKEFLEVASDELRAAFVRGLGSSLGPETDVPPDHWARMRNYWEARTYVHYHIPRGYEMEQEMSAFVSWVRGVPDDLRSLAPLLRPCIEHLATGHDAHDLLAYLSEQSESHALLATEMLGLLLDREAVLARGPDVNRIYLIGAEQYIQTILENAMRAEAAARESAISLINSLGERGDYRYRELLRPRQ